MGTKKAKLSKCSKNSIGFTLVEMIVVITILAILWVISIIAFQWHTSNARDSARISDISSIKKVLGLHFAKNNTYPLPSDPLKIVTCSGGTAFYEGEFWGSVLRELQSLNRAPKDPLHEGVHYTYSVTNNKKQYQIGFASENQLVLQPFIETAFAASIVSQIDWTYSGTILISTGGTTHVLNSPTIITSNTSTGTVDMESLSGSFVSDGSGNNIPFSYSNPALVTTSTPPSSPPGSSGALEITFSEPDGTTVNCTECTNYP